MPSPARSARRCRRAARSSPPEHATAPSDFVGAGSLAGDHRACDLQSRHADPQPSPITACWPGHTIATSPAMFWRCRPSWAARPTPRRSSRQNGVGLVVLCRGNDETGALTAWAPAGFIAALVSGAVPPWLERLPGDSGRTARNLSRPPGRPDCRRSQTRALQLGLASHSCRDQQIYLLRYLS